ncbi:MAG: AgmX/PglI C-terminal domain-containing protein [Proteobacteria bacterium]|nr:AgmX/PglI C-terminal domain-containing protein [Pseudomonadota bacterium]
MSSPKRRGTEVIKVRLLRAGKVIRSYKVRSDTFTIGSAKGCTIRAAGDTALSPKHATIYAENGELTVVPEPEAVVLLNGEPVDFAIPNPDDVIQAGRLSFKVELAESLESLAPPPKPKTDLQSKKPSRLPKPKVSRPPQKKEMVVGERISRVPVPKAPRPSKPPETTARKPSFPDSSTEKEVHLDSKPEKSSPATKVKEKEIEPEIDSGGASITEPELDEELYFDDDDDNELTFEEPFDLAELLLKTKETTQDGPRESYFGAHIVRIVNGQVVGTFGVVPGKPYVSHTKELECRISKGSLSIKADKGLVGDIWKKGTKSSLATMPEKKSMYRLDLAEGDIALLEGKRGIYKIEVYRPPLAPKSGSFRASPRFLAIIGLALVIHVVVSVAVAYVQPKAAKNEKQAEKEVFAVVKMDKPEDSKYKEKANKKTTPKNAKEIAEKAPKVSSRTVRRIRARSKASTQSSSINSLLQVLSRGSGKPGQSNKIKDLISNVDAVPSKGAGSPFSIAGAIASLPGGGVNIAKKGGGGAISTLSGEEVAGKNSGIATLGKGKRKGKVRGKVTKMSSGVKVKGRLSRADVSRVVNSHIHAIQACYERALMNKSGLSGRIVFDWTVTEKGKVKGVRVRSSTLSSPNVANCISKRIKRWKFPRPEGGEVTITYPFLFRSVSS